MLKTITGQISEAVKQNRIECYCHINQYAHQANCLKCKKKNKTKKKHYKAVKSFME